MKDVVKEEKKKVTYTDRKLSACSKSGSVSYPVLSTPVVH